MVFSTSVPLAADIVWRTTAPNGLSPGKTSYFLALWDMGTGHKRWEVPVTEGNVEGARHSVFDIVAVTVDNVIVTRTLDDAQYTPKVLAYATKDGSARWTSPLNYQDPTPTIVMSKDGHRLAITSTEKLESGNEDFLAILDSNTGDISGKIALPAGASRNVVSWAGEDTVLLGTNGTVQAYVLNKGSQIVDGGSYSHVSAFLVNDKHDVMYVVDGNNLRANGSPYVLRAIDLATRSQRWELASERTIELIAVRDNMVIVNTSNGISSIGGDQENQIVTLDGATGTQIKVIPGELSADQETASSPDHFTAVTRDKVGYYYLTAWYISGSVPVGTTDSDKDGTPVLHLVPR